MPELPMISVEHLPQATVFHVLPPELRKLEADAICSATDQARLTAPSLPFILDLANVAFAGSLALGTLVGLNQEFRTCGQRLIFVNLQTNLREAFSVTHLNRVLEILPDVPTALQSIPPAVTSQ